MFFESCYIRLSFMLSMFDFQAVSLDTFHQMRKNVMKTNLNTILLFRPT